MFYTNRVVFIHQPRTGGSWLTEWAKQNAVCSADIHWLKHRSYRDLLAAIPELAGLQPFTIVRDAEERFESYLRHCRTFDLDGPPDFTENWRQIVLAASSLNAEEFRAAHWLPAEYYADERVKVFPFEPDLRQAREWLCRL